VWIGGVRVRIEELTERLTVHVLTADTYGVAGELIAGLPVTLTVLQAGDEARQKADYVTALGAEGCVAVGNGRNDVGMLECAGLAIAVLESEGCAAQAAMTADVLCRSAAEALDMLLQPVRLRATLRA
jgi:soluble P-type ATPase